MDRNFVIITFILNTFILRRSTEANFPDIIKITAMFIKATTKD